MKKWILFFAVVIGFGAASPALAEIEVSGDAYVSVNSMYLWRGFNLSEDDSFVVQPGADVSFGGFTLSWWGNISENTGEMNEVDLTLDYSIDVNDLLSLSVGNIFYDVDGIADTNELYLGVALNTLLSPALTVYYDYDEFKTVFTTVSVGHTIELAEGMGLNFGALASYLADDEDGFGTDDSWFHNAELSVGMDFAVTDQIVASPIVLFSTPLSDDAEDIAGIDDEIMVGLTVALNF